MDKHSVHVGDANIIRHTKKPSVFSIVLVFNTLAVIGLGLVPQLRVKYLPSSQVSSLSIDYAWPDASPEAIEQQITAILEGGLELISGIKKIYSISKVGNGNIRIDLEKSVDVDFIRFEVASKIRQLYPNLPPKASFPILSVYEPDEEQRERPILIYALSGNDLPTNIYAYAQEVIAPNLSGTLGLNRIEVRGGNQMEWRIIYRPEILASLSLHPNELLQAIQYHFPNEALGITEDDNSTLYVKLGSQESLENIIVKNQAGRIIYLKDLATIELKEQPALNYYRINGQNSVRLLFFAESTANTIVLAQTIKGQIKGLSNSLSNTYELSLEEDSTRFLSEELDKIQWRSLLSLSILLLFVLIIYRSFRFSLLVLGSLLINLGIAIILYYVLQIEINLYALAGITVSFGIIIDNTIVMAHHVQKRMDLRVFPALLASTLTTISALIIIFFLPEKWQNDLASFAQVIAINLMVSLTVALWIVPSLVQRPIKSKRFTKLWLSSRFGRFKLVILRFYEKFIRQLYHFRPIIIVLLILAFGLPVFLLPNKIENWNWYNENLGSDWYIENVKPVVNRVLGGSLRLFMWYVYEGSSYRNPEETVLYIQGSLPQGATVHQLNNLFEQIEGYLSRYPTEVKQFTTRVSSGQYGSCKITFNQGYKLSFPYQLKSRLITQSLNLGGAEWDVYGVGKGFSNSVGSQAPRYQISMYGYHKEDLAQLTQQFAKILLKHPRVQEVNTDGNINWWEKDHYEYQLQLAKSQLANYQLNPNQITRQLKQFDQAISTDFHLPDGHALRLINSNEEQNNLWMLQEGYLPIDSNQLILKNNSELQKVKTSPAIHKEDQQYIQMVEFEYTGLGSFWQ